MLSMVADAAPRTSMAISERMRATPRSSRQTENSTLALRSRSPGHRALRRLITSCCIGSLPARMCAAPRGYPPRAEWTSVASNHLRKKASVDPPGGAGWSCRQRRAVFGQSVLAQNLHSHGPACPLCSASTQHRDASHEEAALAFPRPRCGRAQLLSPPQRRAIFRAELTLRRGASFSPLREQVKAVAFPPRSCSSTGQKRSRRTRDPVRVVRMVPGAPRRTRRDKTRRDKEGGMGGIGGPKRGHSQRRGSPSRGGL